MAVDAPYPELKKTHTMAHKGRPWTDYKPPPAAPVWSVIEGLGSYYILLAAIELDVFDTLESTGPVKVEVLSEKLEVSKPHLQSLLDSLVALGFLDQFVNVYELNDTAKRYLTSNGPASMANLISIAPGPHNNWLTLAETIKNGTPGNPIDNDPASFYVPLVEGTFTTMLRTAIRSDLKIRYSSSPDLRVLDLGAGGAPWSIAFLSACPEATSVVNDFAEVLEVAKRKTLEHKVFDRCEFRPGNFHDIEVEANSYDLVVLGHVCRTEGEDGAANLIDRAFSALKPGGRILVADYFIDLERKFNPHGVLMGMTMMASTVNGFQISNEQVSLWLRESGFDSLRLIEPIGFQFVYVADKPIK
ncbi:MAG: methyltransferase dimerization domain-containing protein [Acidimicrobiales bacterium]|nr:methyltransferase dimerization domain-containing protein [Acidimicrobiales bacterium]